MRHKEKEISDPSEMNAIIRKATICRLGMVNGDKPYVVPMNFGYHNNTIFFHGAQKGLKFDIIKKNPNVCVEFDVAIEVIEAEKACDWSMKFQSVIVFGTASLIDDPEEKCRALETIMAQYSDKVFDFPEKNSRQPQ
ncbi:pyridoxamine 5'-phosphate oxidase family protein [Desulfosarcina cetonica]|uniref:pyridoxamine 5'-phosphate oxidase family protein n=1 Tax=Desulfosarcina cetonica TaxID=90730 RepID=UPI001FEE8B97|nr:pyridoxamine 5'-phosphate oxidase family protein [Desulfosarcina cetonica]